MLPLHHTPVYLWEERDSNPLTARPIRQFVLRPDLQSGAVIFPYYCDPGGIRTHDLSIKSAVLYQLSYEIKIKNLQHFIAGGLKF